MSKSKKTEKKEITEKKKYSRRDFLTIGGAVVAADVLIATTPARVATAAPEVASYPASKGYLVYDSKKCIGCTTCMLSCSLVHYGEQNLSLSRIQIIQDSFGKFPDDIKIAVCRQCVTPPCVINCPVGAAFVDTENGNVRRIDQEKCIGCQKCLEMCPQQPHRVVWNHYIGKSSKCDLCIDTPYWNEKGDQKETEGYDVNLRNEHWLNLGLVENSTIVPPMYKNKPSFKVPPKPKAKAKS